MATKHKKSNLSHSEHLLTYRSAIFWIMSGCLIFFFLFMPFQGGLLNGSQPSTEIEILYSFIIGAILLVCLGIHLYQSRNSSLTHTPLRYIIWSIPLIYCISMLGAVSAHYSYIEFMIWVFYAILFMTAYHLLRQADGQQIAYYIYMGTSAVIVLFGMMNWFGNASLWGLLPWQVYPDAAWNSGIDIRIASVFQYANSYAAYLIAFSFACLATVIYSRNKFVVLFASFMFVSTFVSFIITYSRAGWLVFPIILLLILPLIKFSKQIELLFHLLVGAIATIVILPSVTSLGLSLQQDHLQGKAFKAWSILIVASLITAIISLLFNKYVATRLEQKLQGWNTKKMMNLLLPSLAIVVGIVGLILLLGNTEFIKLLPESIGSRLENINLNQHSVLERGTFYVDAITIWKDYPMFGAGGGAWQALYQQYQNNPYTSNQVHSFFMQMLVEVGIVGILALFIVLITVYYLFIRSFSKKADNDKLIPYIWFIISTSILIHSVLDFNMSYVYLAALVFFSLGGMMASSETKTFQWQEKLTATKLKLVIPLLLIVGAVIYFVMTLVNILGYQSYHNATEVIQEQSMEQSLEQFKTAASRNGDPEYYDYQLELLARMYQSTFEEQYAIEAQAILDKMSKKEPYFENFIFRQLELNRLLQKNDESANVLQEAINKFPWEIDYYVQYAKIQFLRVVTALEQNEIQTANEHLQSIIALRDDVNAKTLELELLPEAQLQGREFGITPKLAMPIGQALFVLGDYEQAVTYLALSYDPAFNDNDDTMAALYYSAVLQKLNQSNEEVNNAIFAAFSDKQEELRAVLDGLIGTVPINN